MSYLARLVSDNFRTLEKLELGVLSFPANPKKKYFYMGSEILRFDLPSSINFRDMCDFPKLEAHNPY